MLSEIDEPLPPGDKSLIDSIIKFSHILRENGVPLNFASILDVARGLRFINISDMNAFRLLLRTNLIFRKEDLVLFETLFESFWLVRTLVGRKTLGDVLQDTEPMKSSTLTQKKTVADVNGQDNEIHDPIQEWIPSYGTDKGKRKWTTEDISGSDEFYELIKKWLKPLGRRASRRSRCANRKQQIDLRKVLRKNIQFGGDLIHLSFKERKLKNKRIVFFCDVSGSMDIFTVMMLHFIVALKRIDYRTEVFLFQPICSDGLTILRSATPGILFPRYHNPYPIWEAARASEIPSNNLTNNMPTGCYPTKQPLSLSVTDGIEANPASLNHKWRTCTERHTVSFG